MGIKMKAAMDSAGAEWDAEHYAKGRGKEPLRCVHCPVQVTYQSAHTRERDDKPILVPAYFRLLPGGHHDEGCKHAVSGTIKTIASESNDLIESIRNGRYRLRLVMIRDALAELSKKPAKLGSESGAHAGKTYERSRSNLPAYINSAKRVLKLRTLCDANDEMEAHLELVFEGNTVVPWSQFYFETERHLDAYHTLARNTVQHPIALHGTAKLKRTVKIKNGISNVLNLAKPRYIADADNPETGVGVEASIWCNNAEWFADLNEGDQVVVLGMWKGKKGEQLDSSKPDQYRYKSFVTHKLSVWPVLLAQIARVD